MTYTPPKPTCYRCRATVATHETWDHKNYCYPCAQAIWGRTTEIAVKPITRLKPEGRERKRDDN